MRFMRPCHRWQSPPVADAWLVLRTILGAFGWRGLVRRVRYVAALQSGLLRRQTPEAADYSGFEPLTWHHRLATPDLCHLASDDVADRAERLLSGHLTFYGWTERRTSWPPDWHVHPWTGHRYPAEHWSTISDDDVAAGDVKDVWETSRWTWTFLLARA
jgi:hypothetical protein